MSQRMPVIGYLGIGAGLMYLLDPDRGRRRRALLRDQLAHTAHKLSDAVDLTSRDLSHRVSGLIAEGSSLFEHDQVSDDVLVARVRSKIGRVVSHPHAIKVTANGSRVSLSGPILAAEVDDLLKSVSKVSGVAGVVHRLEVHEEPGDVSSLQGGRERPGDLIDFRQTNWSPTTRLFAGLAGGVLMANCLKRRGLVGTALGTLGFGLVMRGVTNLEMKRLIGMDGRYAINVQKTINLAAPVERVFEFWTNYQNFPHFMSNVREVRDLGNGRSHWVVAGPAGVPIEWTAVTTERVPNKLIAWQTVSGSPVKHAGAIQFDANSEGGTRVNIRLSYTPLAGAVGHALAKLFGADPKSEMDADLVRMKTMIETGITPHDAAHPVPSGHDAYVH